MPATTPPFIMEPFLENKLYKDLIIYESDCCKSPVMRVNKIDSCGKCLKHCKAIKIVKRILRPEFL